LKRKSVRFAIWQNRIHWNLILFRWDFFPQKLGHNPEASLSFFQIQILLWKYGGVINSPRNIIKNVDFELKSSYGKILLSFHLWWFNFDLNFFFLFRGFLLNLSSFFCILFVLFFFVFLFLLFLFFGFRRWLFHRFWFNIFLIIEVVKCNLGGNILPIKSKHRNWIIFSNQYFQFRAFLYWLNQ
jgi:hypothetical protein